MGHKGLQRWKRRILFLVLVPALLACILLWAAGDGGRSGQTGGGDSSASSDKADSSGRTDTEDPSAAEAGDEGSAPSAGNDDEKADESAGTRSESGSGDSGNGSGQEDSEEVFPGIADPGDLEPLEKICFTAGGDRIEQRSVPVKIKASILGGDSADSRWAVFLPSEMEAAPVLFFTRYREVSLEPLEEGHRLPGGRLGPDTGADNKNASGSEEYAGSAASGKGTYASGDVVPGLSNGSAFKVRMTSPDGSVAEEDLYVFSCTGTPSLYLDTKSGSMEAVDDDPAQETSEEAKFAVYTPEGALDSAGTCSVRGRGNSTWSMKKRPYNLNLDQARSVLGMSPCKKLCLLANTFDHTNLLDRVSARLAISLGMRDTPEGELVNVYLNGTYNGLYYLSQRVRTGGSVRIDKLDKQILRANGIADSDEQNTDQEDAQSLLPKRIALHEEGDKLQKYAYNWPAEPSDNTGGYLLQQHERYDGEDCWFSTEHRRFRIASPEYPTPGEVNYLQDYLLTAERAIYSEDGKDPETGTAYGEILDLASWEDMFLLEEFFVEWDAERWSFFITKDRGDPLLYCGPMWDFDHSAGTLLYGTYPETTVSTLMLRDNRHGWLNRLLTHEDFVADLYSRWTDRFSPAVHAYLDTQLPREIDAIESASYMNNIRRDNDVDFREDTAELTSWLTRRLAFLDAYIGDGKKKENGTYGNTGSYCRVMYEFPWGDLSHYVLPGQALGSLPLPEYGETQIPSQVEKNEIIGWQDENGNPVGPDLVVESDCVLKPVYR